MPKIVTMYYRNLPKGKRLEILERDNYTCQECGYSENRKRLHVHHILAQRHGGMDENNNLVTLCLVCHRIADKQLILDAAHKTQEWSDEYIEEREELIRGSATDSLREW